MEFLAINYIWTVILPYHIYNKSTLNHYVLKMSSKYNVLMAGPTLLKKSKSVLREITIIPILLNGFHTSTLSHYRAVRIFRCNLKLFIKA